MPLPRRAFLGAVGLLGATLRRSLLGRVGAVEIGVCADAAHFSDAVRYGFDYFEPDASEIATMDEGRFAEFRAQVLASPIRCKSFRILFRKTRVVGPDVNEREVETYVDRTLGRCQQLGAEIMVYGSGGSRNVPEGFSRDRAWDQIRSFLRMAGDLAARHEMVIGIEALKRPDSNIINKSAESLRLVHELDHPHVKMIVDFYHMFLENEDPQIVWEAREEIVHLHFANPAGRRWPRSASESPGYKPFFDVVKKINFHRGLSIEGNGTFEADADASMRFFSNMLA
jgi:sugar phosphate isomerase/epimerase